MVISIEDLSGSVWRWLREGDEWKTEKVITVPAEPADPDRLPPALKPFGLAGIVVQPEEIAEHRVADLRTALTC